MRLPKPPILFGLFSTVATSIAPVILRTWLANQAWLQDLPWFWLSIGAGAFMLGATAQDLLSDDSWFRKIIRSWRAVYELESVFIAHRSTPDKEWVEVTVAVKYLHDYSRLSTITRVTAALDIPRAQRQFVLANEQRVNVVGGERQNLVMAVVPIKRYDKKPLGYEAWGDRFRESGDVEGMHSLSHSTNNLVGIEMRAGWWRHQVEQVFVAMLNTQNPGQDRIFIARDGVPSCVRLQEVGVLRRETGVHGSRRL